MLIYHSFCLCMHLASCWTQVFWDGNDHMANTLKINSTCPASRAHHILLMVLFFFFFSVGQWKQNNCLCKSLIHCRHNLWLMLYATSRVWTLCKGCDFMAPLLSEVISQKTPTKTQLYYCFRCCERAHKKWPAAAPELCWCALSWALVVWCARDVQGWQQFMHTPGAVCTPHTSQNS